jgi:hypothetical protein
LVDRHLGDADVRRADRLQDLLRDSCRELEHGGPELLIWRSRLPTTGQGESKLEPELDCDEIAVPSLELLKAVDQEREVQCFLELGFVDVSTDGEDSGLQDRDIRLQSVDLDNHELQEVAEDGVVD